MATGGFAGTSRAFPANPPKNSSPAGPRLLDNPGFEWYYYVSLADWASSLAGRSLAQANEWMLALEKDRKLDPVDELPQMP